MTDSTEEPDTQERGAVPEEEVTVEEKIVSKTNTILNHSTDTIAILTLGYITLHTDVGNVVVGAITAIAGANRAAQYALQRGQRGR